MDNSAKYLIHAAFAADGIVERSDVVGAVYGQTEGLLGEELDIRRLQESSKLGRIDVEVEAAGGQSAGEITVATSLDRVETATLAAALETIDRVGPCRATVEVTNLEDVRAATRRNVVDRAQELLLAEFEGSTSDAIVEEVRRRVATADVTTYEGLPAGPSVADGDAIVVVEGRADVKALLAAGVKNAVAVEGTDVPETVADLSTERRTTAFLDGDRGGELILQELRQVGDVDVVAFAPTDRSVEDLDRSEILAALRSTVDVAALGEQASASDLADAARARTSGGTAIETPDADERVPASDLDAVAADRPAAGGAEGSVERSSGEDDPADKPTTAADGRAASANESTSATSDPTEPGSDEPADELVERTAGADDAATEGNAAPDGDPTAGDASDDATVPASQSAESRSSKPRTIRGHAAAIVDSGEARFLGAEATTFDAVRADDAFGALEQADRAPTAIVLDGTIDQRLLDLAAQRGVREVVAVELGAFTKRPTDVRIRTVASLLEE